MMLFQNSDRRARKHEQLAPAVAAFRTKRGDDSWTPVTRDRVRTKTPERPSPADPCLAETSSPPAVASGVGKRSEIEPFQSSGNYSSLV